MAKPFFLLLIITLPSFLFSQNNDELRDILNLPQNKCEEYSPSYAKAISGFGFEDIDSIGKYLDFWIETCGYNEAVFRVFVLMSIQEGEIKEEDIGSNYEYFISNFQERTLEAQYSGYQNTFENDKAYFLYIPLRSEFDSWTKAWSQNLLKEKNWTGLNHFFLSLYSQKSEFLIEEEINNPKYDSITFIQEWRKETLQETRNEGGFAISLGTWIPQGKLTDYMDISPVLGVNGEVLISERTSIGGNLNFMVPVNKRDFRINTPDSTELTKATFGINFNVYLSYDLLYIKKFKLSAYGGIGFESLITDISQPIENEDEEPVNYSINTYNINAGLDFSLRNKKYNYWGIKTGYTFMDYNIGIRAANDLGGNAFQLTAYYRF